mgnify:CR=1 FL=1
MTLSSSGQLNRDYFVDASLSLAPGASTVYQLGLNLDIDAGPADVWSGGGLYPWMTAATSLEVVSASANDAAAGTGARTVTINGLNASYVEVAQIITMNGTTAVAIPTQLFRINSMTITTAGSGQVNDGNITVRDAGAGTTRALMEAGYGALRQSQFTVPAGKTLLVATASHGINKPSSTRDATVAFYFRLSAGTYSLLFEIPVSSQPVFVPVFPIAAIPEKADIGYRVMYVSATNTIFTSAFFGLLTTNNML